ncbi:MAG: restriction endonuclease subunit S, partial [Candidatus Contendobacter sp.]|nr:restriction endonuclease subunit S [Candidatus Contendobacter sp.]MDG4557613.1 restriction endonuclease subunit S [Candidatus Contendobacter sp.]
CYSFTASSIPYPLSWRIWEWEVRPLEALTTMVASGRSKSSKAIGTYPVHGSTGIIGYTEAPEYVSDAILVARVGANAGKLKVVSGQYGVTDNTIMLRLGDAYSLHFMWRQLEAKRLNNLVFGSGQPLITGSQLKTLSVAVPPLPEQRAIAAALSDVDALLAKLDQLIAKKRDIKQATMQQLLTGRTRLPGFSGEWEVKQFGDLFQFLSTANNPRADLSEFGDVGYVHYGDIHTTNSAFLNCSETVLPLIEKNRVAGFPFIEDGDLVMADASEDYAGIGKCVEVKNVRDREIVAGLHTFLLRGNKDLLSNGFKGYLQFIPTVKTALIRFATGISVYGVTKNNVRSIEIQLPKPNEQTAIAAVLTDMDAEIASLEARRDKTRALKQGMMQELLTGRIRLV